MDRTTPKRKTYDLCLRPGGTGFVWKIADRGITLSGDRITWITGDEKNETALRNIAAVHLQTNTVGQGTIATCRIRFADDSALSVLSSNDGGTYDAGQARLYLAFVRDLHARLATLKDVSIDFTAGFSEARQQFGKVLVVVVVAFFVVMPTVLLLISRKLSLLMSLYFGVFLAWPLYRLVQANAPRSYDPRALPNELIDT